MEWKSQYGFSREGWEKFDDFLQQAIVEAQSNPSQAVSAMIVLHGKRTSPSGEQATGEKRADLAAKQAALFDQEVKDLLETLRTLGAREIQTFWINRTLSAVMPLAAVDAIGRRSDVKQIQLLRKLPAMT